MGPNQHQFVMITINKRVDISGHFVSGSIDEMVQFPDRMKGCYQVILEPFDYYIKDELDQAVLEAAGPFIKIDTSETYTSRGDLILETVVKPYAPDFPNQGEPFPGTGIKATVLPELKYSADHSVAYPQLTIVGIDKYVSQDELTDWDAAPDTGYNF